MDFADLLNMSKKQELKQEEKIDTAKPAAAEQPERAEEKQSQGGEMLGAILPHLLKGNEGMQELMPLLGMLGGGELDYGKLLNMLIKHNKSKKTQEEEKKHKSIFDEYTKLE